LCTTHGVLELEGQTLKATDNEDYALRLKELQGNKWKKLFDVQLPYRWCLRALRPGFTLELGCGIGRNLSHLRGNAIGIDHNELAVSMARSKGFEAYLPQEFREQCRDKIGSFDSLLFSHILEHLSEEDAKALVIEYLPWLSLHAKVISITPGLKGFNSDPTHLTYFNREWTSRLLIECGLTIEHSFCFPFPGPVGRLFKHNEYIVVARVGDQSE
jgi:SAM-dependent methyltransferase